MHYRAELVAESLRKEYPDWIVRAVSILKGAADVIGHRRKKSAQLFISLMPWPLEVEAVAPFLRGVGSIMKSYLFGSACYPSPREIQQGNRQKRLTLQRRVFYGAP
jgi:hypothetical protein